MNSNWSIMKNVFFHRHHRSLSTAIQRHVTSKSGDRKDPRITVTDDGQTIVCWHPPKLFPYEDTLPYTEVARPNQLSVLNVQTIEKGENIYYKMATDRLGMEQLQAITFTNKNHWKRRRYDGLQLRPDHPRKGI